MANSDLAGLLQAYLMYRAGKRLGQQRRFDERTAQEQLAEQRADRDRREQQFRWQMSQQQQEAARQQQQDALARAQPFWGILNNPDALLEAQRTGTLPGLLQGAQQTFGPAGLPDTFSGVAGRAGLQEQRTAPERIETPFASIQPGSVEGPLAGLLPPAVQAATRFAPMPPVIERTQQTPLSVKAPGRIEMPGRSVNPALLGQQPYPPGSIGSLLGGLVTPAGQVSVPRPDIVTERPVESQLLPSVGTEIRLGEAKRKERETESRIAKADADKQFVLERVKDLDATRFARVTGFLSRAYQAEQAGDREGQAALLAAAKTETEEGTREAKVRLLEAQEKNVADQPGSRAAGREVTKRGQDITERTAAQNRAGRASEGAANRDIRLQIASLKQQRAGMTDIDKRRFDYAQKRTLAQRRLYGGGSEPAYTPEELAGDYAVLDELRTKYGTGAKPGAPAGVPAGGGTTAPVPARGLQLPPEDRQRVRNYIKGGQFEALLNAPAAQQNPDLRNALLREYANVMGRPYKPRGR